MSPSAERKSAIWPGPATASVDSLKQMGYAVKPLTGADLASDELRGLDAVVIGIRAFNVRTDLARDCRTSSPLSKTAAMSSCSTTSRMAFSPRRWRRSTCRSVPPASPTRIRR